MQRQRGIIDLGDARLFDGAVAKKACFFCQGHFETLRKVEFVRPTCEDCLARNEAKASFSTVKRVLGGCSMKPFPILPRY